MYTLESECGDDKRARHQEKTKFILSWLCEYQYSLLTIMSQAMGAIPQGQRRFFAGLVESGFLQRFKRPGVSEYIYILTKQGAEIAGRYTEKNIGALTQPSRVLMSSIYHNLMVQKAVVKRLKPGLNHTFEKHLKYTSRDKVPDVILEYDGEKTALEIELSRKENKRVYRAFYDHIQAFKNGHYSKVEYIFQENFLLNNYQSKFTQKEWPIVSRKNTKLIIQEGEIFHAEKYNLQTRFIFTLEDFGIL